MHRCIKIMTCSVAASAVAIAMMAAPALAADPQAENCAGLEPGVNKLDLKVEPNTAGSVSSFKGGVLLCDSDLGPNDPKGFKSGTVDMPVVRKDIKSWTSGPGSNNYEQLFNTRCANPKYYNTKGETGKKDCPEISGPYSLKEGQYTGSVGMGISLGNGSLVLNNALSKVYVQKAPGTPEGNTECTEKTIACLQGTDGVTGYADITIVKKPGGYGEFLGKGDLYEMKIGEIKQIFDLGQDVYYTRIGTDTNPLNLCAYAGDVDGSACGTPDSGDWIQKNSDHAARAKCSALLYATLAIFPWLDHIGWGFMVTTDNNVPGADNNRWGNEHPEKWRESGYIVPSCAPLNIVSNGAARGR